MYIRVPNGCVWQLMFKTYFPNIFLTTMQINYSDTVSILYKHFLSSISSPLTKTFRCFELPIPSADVFVTRGGSQLNLNGNARRNEITDSLFGLTLYTHGWQYNVRVQNNKAVLAHAFI